LLLVALAAIGITSGCTNGTDGGTASEQEIPVGLLAPLKGPDAAAGLEAQRGASLAADVINGANPSIPLPLADGVGLPNLGRARIKIVTADTQGDQQVAADAVNRLTTEQQVAAIVGAYNPTVTEVASQRAERAEVPFINSDSAATFLTEGGRDWFFRVGPSWRAAGEAFFSLLRGLGGGARKTLVLHPRDDAGYNVLKTVRGLSQEGGFPAPDAVNFDPSATDLLGTVDAVRVKAPDTIFVYASPATVQPLIRAFVARQYRPKVVLSFGLGYLTARAYDDNASAVRGLCRSVSWSTETAERNPAARAVASLYQRKYNTPMTEAAANGFTAVLTLAQAIDAARSAEPTQIRTAMLSLDIPGDQTIMPWSGIRFDENHQNVGAQALVEQLGERTFHVVYPRDAQSRSLQLPANGATS